MSTNIAVLGAQWGDEGKGKIVDMLTPHFSAVARYQGGHNAGHTVYANGRKFVLRLLPSGILHPGITCVIGNGVVVDPQALFAEIDELTKNGIDVGDRILISDKAHLILPYHRDLDLLSEARRGERKIGTTSRGIGPAYEDKYGRRGMRLTDLRRLECARTMLAERVGRANRLLEMMGSSERASLDQHIALLDRLAPRLIPLTADTGLLVHRAVRSGRRVLLEGAQGALLDVDHGTYPFVTSSNTTAGGAAVGAGIGPTAIDGVLGVVKAYTTRVGNGPLPTEAEPPFGERLRELGGEFGAVTGRPRRCGWVDATVVRYAARVNGLTGLAVTKLDVLDSFAEVPICSAYRLDGESCAEMPAEVEALGRVQPIYEVQPGWQQPTGDARRLADLPPAARAYLDRLQALIDVPVRYVSVGTRRDQIIEV